MKQHYTAYAVVRYGYFADSCEGTLAIYEERESAEEWLRPGIGGRPSPCKVVEVTISLNHSVTPEATP